MVGLDGARRQVQRGAANSPHHVAKGQAITTQGVFRHLHRDLIGPGADQLHHRHVGLGGQIVAQKFTQFLQLALAYISRHCHYRHMVTVRQFGHNRTLRIHRKGGDGIDPTLYLRRQALHVVAGFSLYNDPAHALARSGAYLLDPVQVMHRLLYAHTNLLLDFTGPGPAIGHGHTDLIQFEIGKKLLVQGGNCQQATDKQEHHQQVSRDGVVHKPMNGSPH